MFLSMLIEFISLAISMAAYLLVMGLVMCLLELPMICAALEVAPWVTSKVDKVTPGYRAIFYCLWVEVGGGNLGADS
jgi:hypothetical protein